MCLLYVGYAVAQLVEARATNRKVAGSIPDGKKVKGFPLQA
jgi:hypothetical protein